MGSFFSANIGVQGRIVRAILAVVLLVGGIILSFNVFWAGVVLVLVGAFVMFEAMRGWCLARACGIKTKV